MRDIITNGVVQKSIDFLSWKLIAASKGYCKTINQNDNLPQMDVVKKFLESEVVAVENLSDRDLYYWLVNAIADIFTPHQLNKFIQYDLKELFDKNLFERKEISYKNICELLITKLHLLQIRESVDNELIDLFVIFDEDGIGMSIDQANEKWLGKEKTLTK